jgi:tetratricopeptide (TPR) repeat protein
MVATLIVSPALAAPLTHDQALAALDQTEPAARLAGVERLAEIGAMADANRLLPRLRDADARVRSAAEAAIWTLWGRSGDPAIDKRYARGLAQMDASALVEALATFDDIVKRKPEFAEGWNKRATVEFLLGHNALSLQDCDEVLKRNPHHFGALSGAGQIHLQMGHLELALALFKRALAINPNLDGLAQAIEQLEQRLQSGRGMST